MTNVDRAIEVRELKTAPARKLAALASIFGDLQTVLRCCEGLVARLANPTGYVDDLELEALWTTALLSYARCFTGKDQGVALTKADVTGTSLQGEVLEWHGMLRQLRKHYADPANNPRERFSVGAAQDENGVVGAIAITSSPVLSLDERTVRQTGALALELSKLVDTRIEEQQQLVLAEATALSQAALEKLPLIDVTAPEPVSAVDSVAAAES